MIYLFPSTDWWGNFPVWSVNIFSLLSHIYTNTSLCFFLGSSEGAVSCSLVCSFSFLFVDLTPCLLYFMCPWQVSSDSENQAWMLSVVRHGQPTSQPFLTAWSMVALIRKPKDPWRYFITFSVVGRSYTLLSASYGGELQDKCVYICVFDLVFNWYLP